MAYTPSSDFTFSSSSYTPSSDFSFASTYMAAVEGASDTLDVEATVLVQCNVALGDSLDVFAGTGEVGWHLIASLSESGTERFISFAAIPRVANVAAAETEVDVVSALVDLIAQLSAPIAEVGSDTGNFAAVHTFHATVDLAEVGSDIGSITAQNLVTGRVAVFERSKDSFGGLSTHANYVYVQLVESRDVLAATGVVPHNCELSATESANDRFFCYTAGIFPLHAARGYLLTLPSRKYNVAVL